MLQQHKDKTILKPAINSFAFESVKEGTKAERLIAKADALLPATSENVTVVGNYLLFRRDKRSTTSVREQLSLSADFFIWHVKGIQRT